MNILRIASVLLVAFTIAGNDCLEKPQLRMLRQMDPASAIERIHDQSH